MVPVLAGRFHMSPTGTGFIALWPGWRLVWRGHADVSYAIDAQVSVKGDFTPEGLDEAHSIMVLRVRPKAMTVAVIIAGLLPILWGTGAGSEVMSRIAAPMIGGMITAHAAILFPLFLPPTN